MQQQRPTRVIGGGGSSPSTTLPSISNIVQQQFMDMAPRKTHNKVMVGGGGAQSALSKVAPQSHRNSKNSLNLLQAKQGAGDKESSVGGGKQQVTQRCVISVLCVVGKPGELVRGTAEGTESVGRGSFCWTRAAIANQRAAGDQDERKEPVKQTTTDTGAQTASDEEAVRVGRAASRDRGEVRDADATGLHTHDAEGESGQPHGDQGLQPDQ